jgi:hypothetical protein
MAHWLPSYKTLFALCAISVLVACGEPPAVRAPVIQTEVVIPNVDPRALVCPQIPIPPDPDTATQRDVAAYIPTLIEVAEHCRRDLATVRRTLEAAAASAANRS